MNWSKCRQSAGVDARSERLQVVHCVRGEHSTSCFSDSLRLQSASMTGVKQARATRCAAEPSLRDGMSVQEASRCRQEQSWCRAGERGDRSMVLGWQPRRLASDVRGKRNLCSIFAPAALLDRCAARDVNTHCSHQVMGLRRVWSSGLHSFDSFLVVVSLLEQLRCL